MKLLDRLCNKIVLNSVVYQNVVKENKELNTKLQQKQEDINKTNSYWKFRLHQMSNRKSVKNNKQS